VLWGRIFRGFGLVIGNGICGLILFHDEC